MPQPHRLVTLALLCLLPLFNLRIVNKADS